MSMFNEKTDHSNTLKTDIFYKTKIFDVKEETKFMLFYIL